jgi:Xaa-Pro dipeptidase
MNPSELFESHLRELQRRTEDILRSSKVDGLVVHSGTPMRYFADDQEPTFRPTPHFARFTPLGGPGHLLVVRPGARPKLVRFAPEDYWYEQLPLGKPFWAAGFDVEEVGEEAKTWTHLPATRGFAFVGDCAALAREHGFADAAINPEPLVARLDWDRSLKTPYEIACIEEAERVAARGHRVAREAFEEGESELDIHHAYLEELGVTEEDLPYPTIIAQDEKSSILHYTGKRRTRNAKVLLIDSGARHGGYASDITRTWATSAAEPVFRELIVKMDALQQSLCAEVRPGRPYLELHELAHVKIGDALHEVGVLRVGGREALARAVTQPFFPHGLGHFLGLQVHDVAGHQRAPEGGKNPPPGEHPFLRTTRLLAEHQVFTIEPGLYFIPMLLRPHRSGPHRDVFDWALIERLMPSGGIRIEDNVAVTATGHRNLTRPHLR